MRDGTKTKTRRTRGDRRASDLRALRAIQRGSSRSAAAAAEGITRVQLWRRIRQLAVELGADSSCATRNPSAG